MLGQTKNEIKAALNNRAGYQLIMEESFSLFYNVHRDEYSAGDIQIMYFFGDSTHCWQQSIYYPKSRMNEMIKEFDKDYVKTGDLSWKSYEDLVFINIDILKDNQKYFMVTMSPME